MEMAVLVMTHLMLTSFGFAIGRLVGYRDAQPKRNKQGRFIKREG